MKPYRLEFDFEYFCIHQLLNPDEKEKFKAWLGPRANQKYTQPEWTFFWESFKRSTLDLELA